MNVVDRPLLQSHAVVSAAARLSEAPAALPERFDGDSLLHRLQDAAPRAYALCLQFLGARQHEEPEEMADLSPDAAAVARAEVVTVSDAEEEEADTDDDEAQAEHAPPSTPINPAWLEAAQRLAKKCGITHSEWYEISQRTQQEIEDFLAAISTQSSSGAASSGASSAAAR